MGKRTTITTREPGLVFASERVWTGDEGRFCKWLEPMGPLGFEPRTYGL